MLDGKASQEHLNQPMSVSVEDLRVPPGNRLHSLKGNRAVQHAISINDQWRICFRFVGEDAFDVEICDYH